MRNGLNQKSTSAELTALYTISGNKSDGILLQINSPKSVAIRGLIYATV